MTDSTSTDRQPPRVIGPLGGYAIVAGSMIGIGIFLSPPVVAAHIQSPLLFLGLWLLGGSSALAGAVACAELGAMIPRSGGDYVFQREAFGPAVAFASGWILFGAIFSGSIATMAVGVCNYQLPPLLGIDLSTTALTLPFGTALTRAQMVALVLVPMLTLLNLSGARPSARTQTVLTLVPIAILAALAAYAIATGGAAPAATHPAAVRPLTLGGIAVAYMAVYFAFSGWINVIYVAGEVEQPSTNIPRALIWGTLSITALYMLLCVGFMRVIGMDALPQVGEAGTAMATALAGRPGQIVITSLIASAALASINATILGGARVAYAMAQRGAGFRGLAELSERGSVPARALWLQAAIAELLIVSGRFEQLYSMVSLTMVVTGSLTVGSLFVLRRSQPERERPYRAGGYPWLPAFYIVSSLVAVVVMARRALTGEPGAWYPLIGLAGFFVLLAAHRAFSNGRSDRADRQKTTT